MKVLGLLLTFCLFWIFENCEMLKIFSTDYRNNSNLEYAFIKVAHEVTKKNYGTLSLIVPDGLKNYAISNFKENVLIKRADQEQIIFCQETTSRVKLVPGRRRRFVAFFMESYDQFSEFYDKIQLKVFEFYGYYVIIFVKGQIAEIEQIFKLLWKVQIYNVIAMFDNGNGNILLKTFTPFKAGNCNDTTPITVNEFKDGAFVNDVQHIFPDKMKNLHKCPIRVSISVSVEPSVILEIFSNGSYELRGQVIKILQIISDKVNFTIDYTYIGPEGYLDMNGTGVGPLKAILDDEADLSISAWWLKPYRMKFFDASIPYLSDNAIFVIPPGRMLTAFEKLVYPLSTIVWISILIVSLVGCLVIFFINRRSLTIRNFVFGRNVRHPYMNMLIATIGGAQKVLPGRNFSRFLLMMYLMYTLVLRAAYQGSYYELLRSDKKVGEVQSIDEMIEKDFEFYVDEAYADTFLGTDAIRERFEC